MKRFKVRKSTVDGITAMLLEPDESGAWVRYEDVSCLSAEDARKKNAIKIAIAALEWEERPDKAALLVILRKGLVPTEQDGINDRGSDEYANPDDTQQLPDEGNTWQCSKCGEVNAGAYCPCSYEVMNDEPV